MDRASPKKRFGLDSSTDEDTVKTPPNQQIHSVSDQDVSVVRRALERFHVGDESLEDMTDISYVGLSPAPSSALSVIVEESSVLEDEHLGSSILTPTSDGTISPRLEEVQSSSNQSKHPAKESSDTQKQKKDAEVKICKSKQAHSSKRGVFVALDDEIEVMVSLEHGEQFLEPVDEKNKSLDMFNASHHEAVLETSNESTTELTPLISPSEAEAAQSKEGHQTPKENKTGNKKRSIVEDKKGAKDDKKVKREAKKGIKVPSSTEKVARSSSTDGETTSHERGVKRIMKESNTQIGKESPKEISQLGVNKPGKGKQKNKKFGSLEKSTTDNEQHIDLKGTEMANTSDSFAIDKSEYVSKAQSKDKNQHPQKIKELSKNAPKSDKLPPKEVKALGCDESVIEVYAFLPSHCKDVTGEPQSIDETPLLPQSIKICGETDARKLAAMKVDAPQEGESDVEINAGLSNQGRDIAVPSQSIHVSYSFPNIGRICSDSEPGVISDEVSDKGTADESNNLPMIEGWFDRVSLPTTIRGAVTPENVDELADPEPMDVSYPCLNTTSMDDLNKPDTENICEKIKTLPKSFGFAITEETSLEPKNITNTENIIGKPHQYPKLFGSSTAAQTIKELTGKPNTVHIIEQIMKSPKLFESTSVVRTKVSKQASHRCNVTSEVGANLKKGNVGCHRTEFETNEAASNSPSKTITGLGSDFSKKLEALLDAKGISGEQNDQNTECLVKSEIDQINVAKDYMKSGTLENVVEPQSIALPNKEISKKITKKTPGVEEKQKIQSDNEAFSKDSGLRKNTTREVAIVESKKSPEIDVPKSKLKQATHQHITKNTASLKERGKDNEESNESDIDSEIIATLMKDMATGEVVMVETMMANEKYGFGSKLKPTAKQDIIINTASLEEKGRGNVESEEYDIDSEIIDTLMKNMATGKVAMGETKMADQKDKELGSTLKKTVQQEITNTPSLEETVGRESEERDTDSEIIASLMKSATIEVEPSMATSRSCDLGKEEVVEIKEDSIESDKMSFISSIKNVSSDKKVMAKSIKAIEKEVIKETGQQEAKVSSERSRVLAKEENSSVNRNEDEQESDTLLEKIKESFNVESKTPSQMTDSPDKQGDTHGLVKEGLPTYSYVIDGNPTKEYTYEFPEGCLVSKPVEYRVFYTEGQIPESVVLKFKEDHFTEHQLQEPEQAASGHGIVTEEVSDGVKGPLDFVVITDTDTEFLENIPGEDKEHYDSILETYDPLVRKQKDREWVTRKEYQHLLSRFNALEERFKRLEQESLKNKKENPKMND